MKKDGRKAFNHKQKVFFNSFQDRIKGVKKIDEEYSNLELEVLGDKTIRILYK